VRRSSRVKSFISLSLPNAQAHHLERSKPTLFSSDSF